MATLRTLFLLLGLCSSVLFSAAAQAQCMFDFNCGLGRKCMKGTGQLKGICITKPGAEGGQNGQTQPGTATKGPTALGETRSLPGLRDYSSARPANNAGIPTNRSRICYSNLSCTTGFRCQKAAGQLQGICVVEPLSIPGSTQTTTAPGQHTYGLPDKPTTRRSNDHKAAFGGSVRVAPRGPRAERAPVFGTSVKKAGQ